MSLSVFATITPKSPHFDDARNAIVGIIGITRDEPGCLQFKLHQSTETGRLYLYEVWGDRDAFDAHHAQPYTQAVYAQYEGWLDAPVDLIFMQPV